MKPTFLTMALTALALSAATLMSAPIAAADSASFLDEIGTNGASIPGKTPSENIGAGYQVCGELRGGTSVLDEMSAVEQRFGFSQGTLFVSASTTNLCPDFAG